MSNQSRPENIVSNLQFLKKKTGLPPVHSWNPPFCGDIDMRISRDGRWHYNGSPIGRESMVKLFASVLRHDDDGYYYLVTPVEKVRIQVDDVPFVAVSAEVRDGDNGPEYLFSTNVGDEVVLDSEHPLVMMKHKESGESIPYIRVRDRLNALVSRNVFYQLVEEAIEVDVEGGVELRISSQGREYSLGVIEGG
ncbi:DUF1285 domain-containing protein [Endozoicomonas atrinae]|uniref:DUF1285 domain-containing protein n=1 Tax=Endozoicomonas atrinae TaxID=1333660 RepID=UPI00082486E8|nr:DUF1285 domain-containing protein [Endozoicomonas atrinae]